MGRAAHSLERTRLPMEPKPRLARRKNPQFPRRRFTEASPRPYLSLRNPPPRHRPTHHLPFRPNRHGSKRAPRSILVTPGFELVWEDSARSLPREPGIPNLPGKASHGIFGAELVGLLRLARSSAKAPRRIGLRLYEPSERSRLHCHVSRRWHQVPYAPELLHFGRSTERDADIFVHRRNRRSHENVVFFEMRKNFTNGAEGIEQHEIGVRI